MLCVPINPLVPNGFFYLHSLNGPFPVKGVSGKFLLLPCFIKKSPVFNTNSVDPDQMPHCAASHSAASDLGLHHYMLSINGLK